MVAYDLAMTIQMNIAEAKAKLSELIARAEAGEQVVIARDGKPIVSLAPVQASAPATRRLGLWDSVGGHIPEDLFLGPDNEIQHAMALWEAAAIQPDL
jgi:prevent-host-death family protein